MGVRDANTFRQSVQVGPGHLSQQVGGTYGERRSQAIDTPPQTAPERSGFAKKLKNIFGLGQSQPAANAQYVDGSARHPLTTLGDGHRPVRQPFSDEQLVAYLSTIADSRKK